MATTAPDASMVRRKLAGSSGRPSTASCTSRSWARVKRVAEEGVRDAAVLHLGAQPPEGVVDDEPVVEGEFRQVVGREPAHVLADARLRGLLAAHERPVHDRDDAVAGGRAADVAERVELFEVARREPVVSASVRAAANGEVLVEVQRAARQRPASFERAPDAAHQRQPHTREVARLLVFAQGEDDGGDGQERAHGLVGPCFLLLGRRHRLLRPGKSHCDPKYASILVSC